MIKRRPRANHLDSPRALSADLAVRVAATVVIFQPERGSNEQRQHNHAKPRHASRDSVDRTLVSSV